MALFVSLFVAVLFGCGGGGGGDSGNGGNAPANSPPVANAGTLTVTAGTPQAGTLSASDPNGDPLTFAIVTNGSKGTAAITNASTGAYVYTPNSGQSGTDTFTFKANDGKADSNTATVTVTITITPANAPPVANAGSPQTVNEGALVTLSGTGTDSDGTVTGFSWTQTAGSTVTLTGANTATPSFTAPAVTAPTVLTFALTVTDNLGAASTNPASVNVTVNLAALLSVTTSVPPDARVAFGSLDWAHWGLVDETSFNHKDGVTQQISNFTVLGSPNPAARFDDAEIAFSWSGGAPTPSAVDTTTGIYFLMPNSDGSDIGDGFSLEVLAGTTPKTLKIWLGGFQAEGKLTATLGGGGVDPVGVLFGNESDTFARVATITFKALSDQQTLTVTYVLNDDFGTPSNLALQAAELTNLAAPAISPPGGVFTGSVNVGLSTVIPGAAIRYTVDGSDPTATSTLFTAPFSVASTQTVKARVFVAGLASDVTSALFTVNPTLPAGGSLSAFLDVPAATTVNLTTEGGLDWAQWGLVNATSFDHKADVTQQISNFAAVGSPVAPLRFDAFPIAFSWSDGTPTASATNATTGIFFSSTQGLDIGKGYSLEVPAGTTQKTLKVYLGGFSAEGTLTAQLSDGSATDVTMVTSNQFGGYVKVVTITFKAASAGQTLTVSYTLTDDFGNPSNLTLQAATLD